MLAPFGLRPKGTVLVRMLPLAQALSRRGHNVSIVAPPLQNPQDAGLRAVYDGVPVIHTPLPTLAGPAGMMQQVAELLRHALAERPDVLHLFKPKGYSGLAALLGCMLRPRLPLVVDTDDWEGWGGWNDLLPYPRLAKQLFAWQERDLPRRAAAVTVASRTLETQVWGFGVAPERVFYLPNGPTDLALNRPTQAEARRALGLGDGPLLLLYTRFWEFDLADVIRALVAIVGRCPDVRLLVVGRGERGEDRDLLWSAGRAGLARAIEYRGWVEPEHIPLHLAAADIALYPIADRLITRAKCPAKLLELMAAGLPIIAGRVGQVAEYLEDGVSGLLTPPADPAALARAVLALLADAPMRARLGRSARERVTRTFGWETLVGTAERAYRIATGGYGGRALL
jgi:glycosyltransferase involved in cell wall biosynthesis